MSPGRRANRINSERVKERLCFYASYCGSQRKTRARICFECSRVQPLHNPVTGFGAKRRCVVFSLSKQHVYFHPARPISDYEAASSTEITNVEISRNAYWALDSSIIRNTQKKKRQPFYAGVQVKSSTVYFCCGGICRDGGIGLWRSSS